MTYEHGFLTLTLETTPRNRQCLDGPEKLISTWEGLEGSRRRGCISVHMCVRLQQLRGEEGQMPHGDGPGQSFTILVFLFPILLGCHFEADKQQWMPRSTGGNINIVLESGWDGEEETTAGIDKWLQLRKKISWKKRAMLGRPLVDFTWQGRWQTGDDLPQIIMPEALPPKEGRTANSVSWLGRAWITPGFLGFSHLHLSLPLAPTHMFHIMLHENWNSQECVSSQGKMIRHMRNTVL